MVLYNYDKNFHGRGSISDVGKDSAHFILTLLKSIATHLLGVGLSSCRLCRRLESFIHGALMRATLDQGNTRTLGAGRSRRVSSQSHLRRTLATFRSC